MPSFTGNKVFDDYSLDEISKYIDWTPFFHSWEMKGSYPKIFNDDERGVEAKKLFDDAQKMLQQVIDEKWLTAKAVIGIFPAASVDDDIEVYESLSREKINGVFHTLRQQTKKPLLIISASFSCLSSIGSHMPSSAKEKFEVNNKAQAVIYRLIINAKMENLFEGAILFVAMIKRTLLNRKG